MSENILTFIRTNDKTRSNEFLVKKNCINFFDRKFHFDFVLENSSQNQVFNLIQNSILNEALKGYNCSIFAYGQTGSGKTFTILGNNSSPGLIPLTLEFLHEKFDFLKLSFVEIYNENLFDLSDKSLNLNIRDDPKLGVLVDNLKIEKCINFEQSINFYKNALKNRKIRLTKMNDQSSRSHIIFNIYLEIRDKKLVKKSKISFIDLAGSEKMKYTDIKENSLYKDISENSIITTSSNYNNIIEQSNKKLKESKDKFKETTTINSSLLNLGKIVHKLSTNDTFHISYRDSKLTFLLKDSLGGNSKLAMIGNINLFYKNDTINTMKFLQRIKMIKNNPKINYENFNDEIKEKKNTSNVKNELKNLKGDFFLYKAQNLNDFDFYNKNQEIYKKIDLKLKILLEQRKNKIKFNL